MMDAAHKIAALAASAAVLVVVPIAVMAPIAAAVLKAVAEHLERRAIEKDLEAVMPLVALDPEIEDLALSSEGTLRIELSKGRRHGIGLPAELQVTATRDGRIRRVRVSDDDPLILLICRLAAARGLDASEKATEDLRVAYRGKPASATLAAAHRAIHLPKGAKRVARIGKLDPRIASDVLREGRPA